MKDKTLKILLGIIAINLTIQTVKDVGLFPTAYAQDDIQRVAICDQFNPLLCADVSIDADDMARGRDTWNLRVTVGND